MTTSWTNNRTRVRSTGTTALPRTHIASPSPWDRDLDCAVAGNERREYHALEVMVVAGASDTADRLAAAVRLWGHEAHAICLGHTDQMTGRPDVVLLDIESMPFGEWQTIQRMRSELARPDCLSVALTRHAGREHRRQCREAGIDLVLVKPVERAEMETLLLLECTRKNRSRTDARVSSWL